MKLKTKLCIDNRNICLFIDQDIFLTDGAITSLGSIEKFIYKKRITNDTVLNVHRRTVALLNFLIHHGELSLQKNAMLQNTIYRDIYFDTIHKGIVLETIDIKQPVEISIPITFGFDWKEKSPGDIIKDIENNFPCYVKTPSNGYHLYFKYKGPSIKGTNLFTSIETKHGSPGLTAPGSVNAEGIPYILHGDIEDAPPLFGLILAKIQKANLQKQETKPEQQKAAADRPIPPTTRQTTETWTPKPRIDLDTLAAETSGGNHDRQVSFAGKVSRMQLTARNKGRDYADFTASAALAYVKAHPEVFGSGADTESTIKSVFKDNGAI